MQLDGIHAKDIGGSENNLCLKCSVRTLYDRGEICAGCRTGLTSLSSWKCGGVRDIIRMHGSATVGQIPHSHADIRHSESKLKAITTIVQLYLSSI